MNFLQRIRQSFSRTTPLPQLVTSETFRTKSDTEWATIPSQQLLIAIDKLSQTSHRNSILGSLSGDNVVDLLVQTNPALKEEGFTLHFIRLYYNKMLNERASAKNPLVSKQMTASRRHELFKSSNSRKIRVVVSYKFDGRDEEIVQEIVKCIAEQPDMEVATGRTINKVGDDDWETQFAIAESNADVIICVISPEYESSPSCRKELSYAIKYFSPRVLALRLEELYRDHFDEQLGSDDEDQPEYRHDFINEGIDLKLSDVVYQAVDLETMDWGNNLIAAIALKANRGRDFATKSEALSVLDEQKEQVLHEISRLNGGVTPIDGRILGVIGSTFFVEHPDDERLQDVPDKLHELCTLIGIELGKASVFRTDNTPHEQPNEFVMLTGGRAKQRFEDNNKGGPYTVSKSFCEYLLAPPNGSDDIALRRTFHFLPQTESMDFSDSAPFNSAEFEFLDVEFGTTIHLGDSENKKRDTMGKVCDVMLLLGGGPGAVTEVKSAIANGTWVIPVGMTGGYAGGIVKGPKLEKPECVAQADWDALQNTNRRGIGPNGKVYSSQEMAELVAKVAVKLFQNLSQVKEAAAAAAVVEPQKMRKFKGKVIMAESDGTEELARHLKTFDKCIYITGHGSKGKFGNIEKANQDVADALASLFADGKHTRGTSSGSTSEKRRIRLGRRERTDTAASGAGRSRTGSVRSTRSTGKSGRNRSASTRSRAGSKLGRNRAASKTRKTKKSSKEKKGYVKPKRPKVCVMYGGDPYNKDVVDIAHVIRFIYLAQAEHKWSFDVEILAIQCDEYGKYIYPSYAKHYYDHLDAVFLYPTKWKVENGRLEIRYGGLDDPRDESSELVGSTKILFDELIKEYVSGVIAVGGGEIARGEVIAARRYKVPCYFIDAKVQTYPLAALINDAEVNGNKTLVKLELNALMYGPVYLYYKTNDLMANTWRSR